MSCEEIRNLLSAYIDGELDAARSLEVERHLEQCGLCEVASEQLQKIGEAVRTYAPYYRAPAGLESRLRAELGAGTTHEFQARPHNSARWIRWALAAVLVLAAALGFFETIRSRREARELFAREVISSHVRSLMANHLMDVPSSDRHTVKPWFNGKLDFSPPVKDLAAQGFTLAGGRLDYLSGRPVAAIVYYRRQHVINLFIWPSGNTAVARTSITWNGYETICWAEAGMSYCAVSDLNSSELNEFVRLVAK